jgi:hypothetical protein
MCSAWSRQRAQVRPRAVGVGPAEQALQRGDADAIRPEHVVGMFRLLGGAPEHGGMGPLPETQLAVLPGTTRFDILYRTDLLMPLVAAFLDASGPPVPGPIMRTGAKIEPDQR